MPAQERSTLSWPALALFVAIAAGGALSWYLTAYDSRPGLSSRHATYEQGEQGGQGEQGEREGGAATRSESGPPLFPERPHPSGSSPVAEAIPDVPDSGPGDLPGAVDPFPALPDPLSVKEQAESASHPNGGRDHEPGDQREGPPNARPDARPDGLAHTQAAAQPDDESDGRGGPSSPGTSLDQGGHSPGLGADGEAETADLAAQGTPVVLYGKGRALDPSGGAVGGEIPEGQSPVGARLLPDGQDSVVDLPLVEDMARFLAENYWPRGSHPMARRHGISTAGVKWANHRYGARMSGASRTGDPALDRELVLQYVFMPSMLRALYGLYDDRFFEALRDQAAVQRRGPDNRPLSGAETAEMFRIYSGMAAGLAGAVRAYAGSPAIRPLIASYAEATDRVSSAYTAHAASREQAIARHDSSAAYREALERRERAKDALASAMRRSGAGPALDEDSLVYVAQWLYRRGEGNAASMEALAAVLEQCAARLADLERDYQTLPAGGAAN